MTNNKLCLTKKQKTIYVLNVRNDEFMEYSAGVYSNIDLAIQKTLEIASSNMDSFNILLAISKIAFSNNNENTTYSKDVIDAATNILKFVAKNISNDLDKNSSDENTLEESFLKIHHLIDFTSVVGHTNQAPQDLYEEFLSYIFHWQQLFQQYHVDCNNLEQIQLTIKQMTDNYQGLYIAEDYPDFDNINFTLEQLQKRYPNISFNQYSFNNNEFIFSINDYWNYESSNYSYIIKQFILDK